MASKLVILIVAITATRFASSAPAAAIVPVAAAPVAHVAVSAKLAESEFDPAPQYSFAYDVQDTLTGDFKSQIENRNGDIVQGQYSLIEPDGTKRIVDYTADPVNGFNAVVSRAAPVAPVVAAPVAPAPVRIAAPVPAARVLAPAPVVAKIATAPHFHAQRLVAPASHAHLVAAPAPVAYTAPHAHLVRQPVGFASPYVTVV
ncbi:larval cuticle protein A2B-like [Atheta coriaria]|uniref:larval cuticle protein A2B-like n=1 Tax=Dalotia coriaria TaxID=877792 RepID=UPI0031F3F60B